MPAVSSVTMIDAFAGVPYADPLTNFRPVAVSTRIRDAESVSLLRFLTAKMRFVRSVSWPILVNSIRQSLPETTGMQVTESSVPSS